MKKIIFALVIGMALMHPVTTQASDEIILHKCQATAYSLKGISADGSVVDENSNNIVASKREWFGCTMIVFLDDGDGIIKAKNYIGTYEVKDTGSEVIKSGKVIDIHVSDYETARNFGRKDVIVQIIKSEG